jgi:hypothetical protein
MFGACSTYVKGKNACQLLAERPGGKKMLEIHRLEDNININRKDRIGKIYLGFLGTG